jgi:hypothetical protein
MSHSLHRGLLLGVVLATGVMLLGTSAAAQAGATTVRPFPLLDDGLDAATGLPSLRPDLAALSGLAALDRVVLTGFTFPGGPSVDLELKRIDLARLNFGFRVDGRAAPALIDGLALSVWSGRVAGRAGSDAVLSFSTKGCRGWVQVDGEPLHLLPQPTDGDWLAHRVLLARESDLADRGMSLGQFCGVAPPATPVAVPPAGPGDSGPGNGSNPCALRNCPMAIETDIQLFEVFGDLGAESAYIATLLAAVSDLYEQQVHTVLTFPYVQFYTVSDPWITPDVFGDTLAMLYEFGGAWAGDEVPAGATLGHYVSGAGLGGGIAWLGVLCDNSHGYTFAVSGDLAGQTPFPIVTGPLNWDFVVFAHETGHNFGAPHTHDMDPPVDECGTTFVCEQGTIMSYCHVACGTMAAITPEFAPQSVAIMVEHADACLPLLGPLVADAATQPDIVSDDVPTALTVQATGVPTGPVTLNYHYAVAAPFQTKAMTDLGGGTWGTTLPAPLCNDLPEWFYSVNDQTCGAVETDHFAAAVGNEIVLAHYMFESPAGWVSDVAGDTAFDGLWELAQPIGDGAAPYADMSAGETDCWVTGNGFVGSTAGDYDVDGGHTTLLSPPIDASAGDVHIGYWAWFTSDEATPPFVDSLVVDVSSDNGGTWTHVETISKDTLGPFDFWTYSEFKVADYVASTANVRVRFIIGDESSDSLVEAAVDEFTVFRVACDPQCQPSLGFGGPGPATLSVCGGSLATGTHAVMSLTGAPINTIATFFVSLSSNPTFFKGGMLVPLPKLLLLAAPTGPLGSFTANVPGGHGPISIYIQAVFPSPGTPPANIGLSNAVRVDLLP